MIRRTTTASEENSVAIRVRSGFLVKGFYTPIRVAVYIFGAPFEIHHRDTFLGT